MDSTRIDAILDLLTPKELGNALWYIRVWEIGTRTEAQRKPPFRLTSRFSK